MVESVYVLCAATSALCAALLFRGYRTNRTRLMLWSSLCFVGLAANNILVFVDLVLFPQIDLFALRVAPELAGMILLLYGLIQESK